MPDILDYAVVLKIRILGYEPSDPNGGKRRCHVVSGEKQLTNAANKS